MGVYGNFWKELVGYGNGYLYKFECTFGMFVCV